MLLFISIKLTITRLSILINLLMMNLSLFELGSLLIRLRLRMD